MKGKGFVSKDFVRQFVPWLLVLSLLANVYLFRALSNHDRQTNEAWSHLTMELLKFNSWTEGEVDRVLQTGGADSANAQTVNMVRESLESLQFLPHHAQRLDSADVRLIDSFYGYVQMSLTDATREYQADGKLSAATVARLNGIKEALSLAAGIGQQLQGLRERSGVWSHDRWKAMWHGLAVELRNVDLEPLPASAPPAPESGDNP